MTEALLTVFRSRCTSCWLGRRSLVSRPWRGDCTFYCRVSSSSIRRRLGTRTRSAFKQTHTQFW